MGINLGPSRYRKDMLQWPCYLLDKVPHAAHSCSWYSMVAAVLTFGRPGTIIQPPNHLICLEYIYSFGHCGHLETVMLGGACAVLPLLPGHFFTPMLTTRK
jgi:hypothetical protein